MTLILDMNLSPKLAEMLVERQIDAKHWYMIGKPTAIDEEIMTYAKETSSIVVTHDLDFTAILCATQSYRPSIIQIRKQGLDLNVLATLLAAAVRQWADELSNGAVLSLDTNKLRVRLLPLVYGG